MATIFDTLPADWRSEIQGQIDTYGLEQALQMNRDWLTGSGDTSPEAQMLQQWVNAGGSMTAQPGSGTVNTGGGTVNTGGGGGGGGIAQLGSINPATGIKWTYGELVNKFRDEFGRDPNGSEFNMWAGERGVEGWTNGPVSPAGGAGGGVIGGASGGTSGGSVGGTVVTGPDGTPMRDPLAEASASYQAMVNMAPSIFGAYQTYAPQYAQTDMRTMGQMLFGNQWGTPGFQTMLDMNRGLTTASAEQTAAGDAARRSANWAELSANGGQWAQTLQYLNPSLWQNADRFDMAANAQIDPVTGQAARNGYQNALRDQFLGGAQSHNIIPGSVSAASNDAGLTSAMDRLKGIGVSPIQQQLEQQAASELALGKSLSAEDLRNAQQSAREAWSARGLVNSNGAVGAEILNRDALGRQREAERQAFAANVDATGFNQRLQGMGSALDLSRAAQGYAGLGLQAGMSNQDAGLRASLANQSAGLEALRQNTALGMSLGQMEVSQNQQALQNLAQGANLRMAPQFDIPSYVLSQNTANAGSNASIFGMPQNAVQSGSAYSYNQFNPFNSYMQDLFNTNYNAGESRYLNAQTNAANIAAARAGASATKTGGLLSGIGSLFGGIFGG